MRELEPNRKLISDHIPFILHWCAGGCWFPAHPWGVGIISLLISRREIHGYNKVPSTYTTNFLWVLYVSLGVPGNFGSHPYSWHLGTTEQPKDQTGPLLLISKLGGKRREEPPSFTTGITSSNKWCSFMKPSNIIFFSFLCGDGRIVHSANATSVIGIVEKQTLHWL